MISKKKFNEKNSILLYIFLMSSLVEGNWIFMFLNLVCCATLF